jgi:hypothetical protein
MFRSLFLNLCQKNKLKSEKRISLNHPVNQNASCSYRPKFTGGSIEWEKYIFLFPALKILRQITNKQKQLIQNI